VTKLSSRLTQLIIVVTSFFETISFPVEQFTVVGQVGVHGIPVINPVEPVFKSVLGVVRAPRLVLAGNHAKEQRGKITSVIRMRVQVRQIRTRALFLEQAIFKLIEISFSERHRVDKNVVR